MLLPGVWTFLHLFFAFAFVGSQITADWNGRAARLTSDWTQRALLFDIVRLSTRSAGLGGLVLLGVFGNLLAVAHGARMASDVWLRWVNGVWLVAVIVMGFVTLPSITRLAAMAREGMAGAEPERYARTFARWRMGQGALSAAYLALLVMMVWRGTHP